MKTLKNSSLFYSMVVIFVLAGMNVAIALADSAEEQLAQANATLESLRSDMILTESANSPIISAEWDPDFFTFIPQMSCPTKFGVTTVGPWIECIGHTEKTFFVIKRTEYNHCNGISNPATSSQTRINTYTFGGYDC